MQQFRLVILETRTYFSELFFFRIFIVFLT